MAELVVSILQLASFWIVGCILLFAEYLDWIGRLEVLEVKHPSVHQFIIARPLRLVLLLLVFGMLAESTKEKVRRLGGESNPPPLKFIAPLPPEIPKVPIPFVESPNSLRRRTVRLADDLDEFYRQRGAHQPGFVSTDPNAPQQQQAFNRYMQETVEICKAKFKNRTMGVVQELKERGLDIGNMEQILTVQGCIGMWSPIDGTKDLRNLAHWLNADDTVEQF